MVGMGCGRTDVAFMADDQYARCVTGREARTANEQGESMLSGRHEPLGDAPRGY